MKIVVICLLLMVVRLSLTAQSTYGIKGMVADSASQKSLDYITLGLKNDKSELLKTGLTKADGSFSFSDIAQGKYSLSIIAMGYKPRSISIELIENKDIGTVYLSQQSTSLNAVIVTADRPLVKMDIDKISYDLQSDPESKVNSVLEMMRRVPLLSLDYEDNIQLKGSGNYRILINGRPSAMLEKNPKDILRSMPASTIQSIEVITNPPAKYDGEGLSGIINIVTVKKIDNGYSGSININQRFPAGGPGLGSSFNLKQGKWGISANLGGSFFRDPLSINSNIRRITGPEPSELRQNGARTFNSRNAYSSTQISYEIDSLNLISGQFAYNLGAFDLTGHLISKFNNLSGLLEAYRVANDNKGNRNGTDVSLNYQLGFKRSKISLVTLSYRYLKYFDERDMMVGLSEQFNYSLPDYLQFNGGGSREQTFQVDYVQPVKKITIESGVKGIFRNNNSDFRYSSKDLSGQYILNPQLSNQYNNLQNVFSFYNSWQLNVKSWGLKAGIRLEQTVIQADFISSASRIDQDYLNLLPSLSVSRTLKDKSSLSFGFSQRIQRPGIWDLNPYVDRSNPNLERTGNPNLRPVVSNNFQVNFNRSKKTSFSIGLSQNFSNNAIQYIVLLDQATNINKLTMSNTGSNNSTGMNMNIGHPITPRWNFNFTTNLNYVFVKGYIDGAFTENDGMKGNFSASTGYRFENGWRINSNMNYMLYPEILLQGSGISIFSFGLSVNKDILKEKLSLSASVNNPFTKYMHFPNYIRGLNYEIENVGRGYFRSFSYSFNYKFGKLKGQIAKNKRGINNDDVLGGSRPQN